MFILPDPPNMPLHQLRQFHQAQKNAIHAELALAGLGNVGHPMLLFILHSCLDQEEEGNYYSQRDLAQILRISSAAVTSSLKSLEREGFVRRQRLTGDQRRNRMIITEKGKAAVEGCLTCFQRVDERVLSGFTPEEKTQLTAYLTRMTENL